MNTTRYMLLRVTENKHNYKLKDLLENDSFRELFTYEIYNYEDVVMVSDELLLISGDVDIDLDGFEYILDPISCKRINEHIYKIRKEVSIKIGNTTLNIPNSDINMFTDTKDHYAYVLTVSEKLIVDIRKKLNIEHYTQHDVINKILKSNTNVYLKMKLYKLTGEVIYRELHMTPMIIEREHIRLPMLLPLKLNSFKVNEFE